VKIKPDEGAGGLAGEAAQHERIARRARASNPRFRLPDASVDGDGLRPEFRNAGWDELCFAIYGDQRWTPSSADRKWSASW
jgi:hypothetical protein